MHRKPPQTKPIDSIDHGFLSSPMQLDVFRTCHACGKRFALAAIRREADAIYEEIQYYRCKKCGAEIAFAKRHPNHTL